MAMNLRNSKYITGWLAVFSLVVVFGVGCDDPYANSVDYSKLQAEEVELRMDFFNEVRDSLMRISSDSIVDMEDNGWVSYEIEKGSTDSVRVGKRVSFKYTYYYVIRDEESDEPIRKPGFSNIGSETLTTYTVGNVGQQDTEVLQGVDLAIRHMCLYGKSYVLMSHSLARNDYYPVVAEIEIVAMDLD
jgi:hypothetical protein